MKKAIITGVKGQDGSYLAELLLSKGYEVHGIVRRETIENNEKFKNIEKIRDKIIIHEGSINEYLNIYKIFTKVMPDECYHLSAPSFVNYSFSDDFQTMNNSFNSTHYLLSTIKEVKKDCKFYFAGSSEMFGEPLVSPQNENTPFNPKSIYGISKVSSHYLVKNYRERERIFASTGIMYNHESPRRGSHFVTKKIISTAVKIKKGLAEDLFLGNLDVKRDWGYAPDYVTGMWQILQQEIPDDFILSTGRLHSVKEFLTIAFNHVGLNYNDYLKIDENFFRPAEVETLLADPAKAKKELTWSPKTNFNELVIEMVESDLKNVKDNF